MAASRPIVARHLFDFREVVGDRHVVTTTVGADLNPVVLSLGNSPDYRVEKEGASFAKRKASEPNHFRIHYRREEQWLDVDVEDTYQNFHAVQPLGSEQWLLVRGRASSPADRNAHIADCYGRIIRSFHAGDGIEDVQATSDLKIWLSYFDEGVFSGMEMGRGGLVCLNPRGTKVFDYGNVTSQQDHITDCYALNASGDHETWLYYYTDFPLVHIRDFQTKHRWQGIPVSGSHAFAIADRHALFFGSYNERQTLFDVNLCTLRAQKLIAVTTKGKKVRPVSAFGRASHLHLLTAESLFLVDWNPFADTY